MQETDVEAYLQALNEELEERKIGKPVRLAIVGGVYMVCLIGNRQATKDIDVVPLSFPDTMNSTKETKAFRSAVNAVAKRFNLRRDWMNDVVASFTPDLGSTKLWREYSQLHVFVPEPECILALKLLSGREKDEDDIIALCERLEIETREQAQALVDRYADKNWQQECSLDATLDALF